MRLLGLDALVGIDRVLEFVASDPQVAKRPERVAELGPDGLLGARPADETLQRPVSQYQRLVAGLA